MVSMSSIVGGSLSTTEQASSSTGFSPPSRSISPSSTGSSLPESLASPSSAASSPQSQSVSPGTIVGIAFGVAALLLLLAVFFWYCRRKTQNIQVITHIPFVDPIPPVIEPKTAPLDTSSSPTFRAAMSSMPQQQARNPPRLGSFFRL